MDIEHILKLARLEVKREEKDNLKKDFSSILNFVKKLEKLNVTGLKPMNYPTDIYNETREDEIKKIKKENTKEKIIQTAADKKENYIKVKEVLP